MPGTWQRQLNLARGTGQLGANVKSPCLSFPSACAETSRDVAHHGALQCPGLIAAGAGAWAGAEPRPSTGAGVEARAQTGAVAGTVADSHCPALAPPPPQEESTSAVAWVTERRHRKG